MNNNDFDINKNLAFTPKLAFDFVSLIERQAKPVYEKMGIIFPVITSSVVELIGHKKKATLSEIAKIIDISHQLASQRVKSLVRLKILIAEKDPSDKRRTYYKLTELGIKQHQLLKGYLSEAYLIFEALNQEFNINLHQLLSKLNASFKSKSLFDRIYK